MDALRIAFDQGGVRRKGQTLVIMQSEHLDHALAEEFAGHADAIHTLKTTSAHFRSLLETNHSIWRDIQNIQSGVTPASDDHLTNLEKQRLRLLDEIAKAIAAAEA